MASFAATPSHPHDKSHAVDWVASAAERALPQRAAVVRTETNTSEAALSTFAFAGFAVVGSNGTRVAPGEESSSVGRNAGAGLAR